jgi:glutamate mutase epsilon subunit
MEYITSQPFLTIVVGLLLIGFIRVVSDLASEKKKSLDERMIEDWESNDDPETELGIGAYQSTIDYRNQPLIVLNHLKEGRVVDKEFAEQYRIKKLSAVISTLRKRGHDIVLVKGESKKYVLQNYNGGRLV